MSGVRTRIAPAPSGSLHVGNARTALFNWLFARRHGGRFILRVEDTDPSRARDEYVAGVMDVLRWLGLDWDEGPDIGGPHGPYRQSERFDRHRAAVDRLVAAGAAYRCYCTAEELEGRRKEALAAGRTPGYDGRCRALSPQERAGLEAEGRPAMVRFAVPEGETTFVDLVHGEARVEHSQIEDFAILRSNGFPLYTLAAAVDDLEMRITHVIRGDDLFAATPKQILLYRALGADEAPVFGHVPLIVGADRRPLSKRHGDVSVEWYRDHGFLPEALVNYLALLGWSPGDGVTERFTRDELVAAFDMAGVTRHPAAFDREKLTALNGEKIRALGDPEIAARIEPFLVSAGVLPGEPTGEQRGLLGRAVPSIRERLARLDEAPAQLEFLFRDVVPDEKASAAIARAGSVLAGGLAVLEAVRPWEAAALQEALQGWADDAGIKRKDAFQPIRAAATGRLVSPPLFESLELLGREVALERVRRAAG